MTLLVTHSPLILGNAKPHRRVQVAVLQRFGQWLGLPVKP